MAGGVDDNLMSGQKELTLEWMNEVTAELQRLFRIMRKKYNEATKPGSDPEVRAAANLAVENFARYHERVSDDYRGTVVFTREAEIEGRVLRGRLVAYEESLESTYPLLAEVPPVQVSPIGPDPRTDPTNGISIHFANATREARDLNKTRGRGETSSVGSGSDRQSTSTRSRASTVRSVQSQDERDEDLARENRRLERNKQDNDVALAESIQRTEEIRRRMALDEELHRSKVDSINRAHDEQLRIIERSEERPELEYESIGVGLGDDAVGEQTRRWVDRGAHPASSTRIGDSTDVDEDDNGDGVVDSAPALGSSTPPLRSDPLTSDAEQIANPAPTLPARGPSLLSRLNKSVVQFFGGGGADDPASIPSNSAGGAAATLPDAGGVTPNRGIQDTPGRVPIEPGGSHRSSGSSRSFRTTEEASVVLLGVDSRRQTPAATATGVEHKHVSIQSPALGQAGSRASSRPRALSRRAKQGRKTEIGEGDIFKEAKMVDDQLRKLEQLVKEKKKEKEEADLKVAIQNSLIPDNHRRKVKAPLASPTLLDPPLVHGQGTPLGSSAASTLPAAPILPAPATEAATRFEEWPTIDVDQPAPVAFPERPGSAQLGQLVEIQTQAAALALMRESRPKEKYNGGKKWAFVKQMKSFVTAISHPSITDRYKLQEIQHYFGGSAYKLVEAETFRADAGAAFEAAMNRLTLKFGVRRETPMEMMEEALQGKSVAEKDPNALLDFYSKILSIHSFALEEGRMSDFDSKMLVEAVLQKKLPHLALKWSKKAVKHLNDTGEELGFEAFLAFVDQEHCISEMMQRLSKVGGQQQKQPQSYAKVASTNAGVSLKQKVGVAGPPLAPSSSSSSLGGSLASTSGSPVSLAGSSSVLTSLADAKCPRCGASHGLADCPIFSGMEVEDRREFCKNIQACYRCMSPGHISKWCKEGINCELCKRQHHTMLHTEVSRPSTAAVAAAAAAAEKAAGVTPVVPKADA